MAPQSQNLSLLSLVAFAATVAMAQASNPVTSPVERCTAVDAGKICNEGEFSSFHVARTCKELNFAGIYACIPGGRFLGRQPAPTIERCDVRNDGHGVESV